MEKYLVVIGMLFLDLILFSVSLSNILTNSIMIDLLYTVFGIINIIVLGRILIAK